ncbi:hypothetical protein TEA_007132 [Camellia sinensis var. sinensis]|uniref:glutathione transferase n=1 Tax=Camellia sinensis var. sinensis TaxID=542762 RepID=A0A4S4DM38_CAMSN|nr:hypothetical protein TEA_007132 [Camellia sinensis var. sinensis]
MQRLEELLSRVVAEVKQLPFPILLRLEASGGGVVVEPKTKLQLYSYFRSSCSQRVRIALNLKGLDYEYKAVNLLKGEQLSPEFLKLNPVGYVPVLVDEDIVLSDSFAILMYLEEKYPQHPLLPHDLQRRGINYQADCFLAPQILGAIKLFSLDMTQYPLLSRLNNAYNELPAFQDAMPENQPDASVEA